MTYDASSEVGRGVPTAPSVAFGAPTARWGHRALPL